MPHQFLHYLELGSDTPKQRRVRVSERMPSDALLNHERLGNGPDVLAENARSPIRAAPFVQSACKYPVVTTSELARLLPVQ